MKQTIEAVINEQGGIRLVEPAEIKGVHRTLLTILDEPPVEIDQTTQLAEKALAEDWLKPEGDEAWSCLKRGNRHDVYLS